MIVKNHENRPEQTLRLLKREKLSAVSIASVFQHQSTKKHQVMKSKSSLTAVLFLVTYFTTCNANGGCVPCVTPFEEAEHIALASFNTLLPPPDAVNLIAKAIISIRNTFPVVSKVRHSGIGLLGAIKIYNYTTGMYCRLDQSLYGPIKRVIRLDPDTVVAIFTRPYNPKMLSLNLVRDVGVKAWPTWFDGPDFGQIKYDFENGIFVFREGVENCGSNCTSNKYWTFTRNERDGWTMEDHYFTGIPQEHPLTEQAPVDPDRS